MDQRPRLTTSGDLEEERLVNNRVFVSVCGIHTYIDGCSQELNQWLNCGCSSPLRYREQTLTGLNGKVLQRQGDGVSAIEHVSTLCFNRMTNEALQSAGDGLGRYRARTMKQKWKSRVTAWTKVQQVHIQASLSASTSLL